MKEGGISARKAGLLLGLSMKKSTLQVRLNRRVTFDRRIEVPSPRFFFLIKNEENKSFADWPIELANCGFGMSTDAFLKPVKKFLDKEVRIIPFLKQPLAFPTIPQSIVMFYFTVLGYIFGIDCQNTLQVQEKLISRLPVEIYVQLLCYCFVRILGRLSGYWAT